MNKYQEALDKWYSFYVFDSEEKTIAKDSYFKLQELIDKNEKLRNHLIEEFNKVARMGIDEEGYLKRFEAYEHYKNGLRYALDFLDKESTNDSTD